MTPNYALQRSVTGWQAGAAGARTIIAPAARGPRTARPRSTRTLEIATQ